MKRITLITLLLLLFSCNQTKQKSTTSFTDALHRKVNFSHTPQRIISLAPSVTELLISIGAQQQLVGITTHCDYAIEKLNNSTKINIWPSPKIEDILKLQPDLVIGIKGITPIKVIQMLETYHIPTIIISGEHILNIYESIHLLGTITSHQNSADSVVSSIKGKIKDLQVSQDTSIKALYILDISPIYVVGHHSFINDKLKVLGCKNVLPSHLTNSYPIISRENILKLNPDVIFTGSDSTLFHDVFWKEYPELKTITAYQKRNIFSLTAPYHSRPSQRIIESIQDMYTCLKNRH